ncbi:hypothetical protein A6R68_11854 [Neotoma lepida]|uniref:Uncharacterized protein n=1 Tax=Neotoma lepida TaxID=56216 RepID=A0A1A6FTW0_NEOLE|nr:hypothetical protein A6R68_11854 [Neotoma lepida]
MIWKQKHCDGFFDEILTWVEQKFWEVEEMDVCNKMGDYLFLLGEDAEKAVMEFNNPLFNGQLIHTAVRG